MDEIGWLEKEWGVISGAPFVIITLVIFLGDDL
jgi:hypothetical protein